MAETEMDYMIKQLVESETKVSSTATLSLSLSLLTTAIIPTVG